MQCVQSSVLFLSMLVLALSSKADQSPDSMDLEQDLEQDLDMELTRHRLLQRARSAGLLTQRAVEDLLLAQMSLPENNVLEPALETAGHVTLQRSVETNKLPPRERKAGCKNFYWKGLTSC
ncbi:somatostatin-2-like [Eucyclogobius newberryi]|uniref:somatostatin-2-like n=1 Tax=Eucyclogobius newberryi TaxID=166745 RepID=UPI003B58FBB6